MSALGENGHDKNLLATYSFILRDLADFASSAREGNAPVCMEDDCGEYHTHYELIDRLHPMRDSKNGRTERIGAVTPPPDLLDRIIARLRESQEIAPDSGQDMSLLDSICSRLHEGGDTGSFNVMRLGGTPNTPKRPVGREPIQ
jgi:hypothetical protein